MLLVVDNYDSFTYNLVDYFEQLGAACHVVRNDVPVDQILSLDYQGVVLSPGPETPSEAGNLLQLIDYYHDKKPILGVCLGHQALGMYFGASLIKAAQPMHGMLSEISVKKDPLFYSLPPVLEVVRYHSLVLAQLPKELMNLSETEQEELMVMKHNSLPIYGIQFHPESILTKGGLSILKNWLEMNGIN